MGDVYSGMWTGGKLLVFAAKRDVLARRGAFDVGRSIMEVDRPTMRLFMIATSSLAALSWLTVTDSWYGAMSWQEAANHYSFRQAVIDSRSTPLCKLGPNPVNIRETWLAVES